MNFVNFCLLQIFVIFGVLDRPDSVIRILTTIFFAQKTLLGLHMNRLKRFRELFRFCEDIQFKSSKTQNFSLK